MSNLIQAWQRYQARQKYEGPDVAMLDGHTIVLNEESQMPLEFALPKHHMDNLIRFIKKSPLERVLQIKQHTWNTLKRLELKRDVRLARKKVPKGSDQGDVGSVITWLNRVPKTDEKACRQVRVVDATCCRRAKG